MTPADRAIFVWRAVAFNRLRSFLTVLGVIIGIASVILLTSLGEGVRTYVLSEFSQFGTNLLQINPGRVTTHGIPGIASTIRKLTIDDAEALRRVAGVERVIPVSLGMARVEGAGRGRSVFLYGVTSDVPEVWKFEIGQGRFLPEGDPRRASSLAVLGPTLKRELFGEANALGEPVRIAGRRFQVIGVMAPKGLMLGFDVDDAVYVPVAAANLLFNQDELMEIHVLFSPFAPADRIVEGIRTTLMRRHGGEEDFTITTQTEMLDVADRVFGVISLAVSAIGSISLIVGAIGILTMMWISVGERTGEIGLLKALGATPGQILTLFLLEAAILSFLGGVAGVAGGLGLAWLIRWLAPGLPLVTPTAFVLAAVAVSAIVGLASGVLPARRAARLDPIDALRTE